MRRIWVLAALSVMVIANLVGCSSGARTSSVRVFAAASLKSVFTEIAERFSGENPGLKVELEFGGSSELALQLTQGAAADVFASANTAQMDKVSEAGLLTGEPIRFAANTLVIVTAPGNPKKVTSFADLAKPGLAVVVCQRPVPCGAAARKIEEQSNVHISPVSEEPDVTDVLNKVISGQADAGLVYRTDAIAAGRKVQEVAFPESSGVVNTYPIAVLRSASGGSAAGPAQRFVDLVTGVTGRTILDRAGFTRP